MMNDDRWERSDDYQSDDGGHCAQRGVVVVGQRWRRGRQWRVVQVEPSTYADS